ncbi:MAG: sugar phosphate isomerase/epimerase [Phycisphaeraceae bacterium]
MNNVSRRSFMIAGAAVAGTAWIGGFPARTHADTLESSAEKYGGFKMGVQSYSFRNFNLEQTIERVADLDLHYVEFFGAHFGVTDDTSRIKAVKALLSPHGLNMPIHGVHGFSGDAAHNRRLFTFAKLAGIPLLSCDPAPDSFPILHDLVQEFDIKVGIHNHGPNHRYDMIDDSLEAVERWDKRIGFCPDTGHYMRSGENPIEMVHKLKDRLHGMHLKDQDGIHRNEPPETILGEGALDLKAFCSALREIGYDAPISYEYELNPQGPSDDMRKGLANFAEAARATA